MADPDLQMEGGGGGGSGQPQPEIRGVAGLQKYFFGGGGSKSKGEARAPRALPLDPPLFIIWPF